MDEGPRALFYGLAPGMARQCLFNGVGNGLYPPIRGAITGPLEPGQFATIPQKICASLISGSLAISVACPTDVIKVRIQSQGVLPLEQRPYKGVFDCIKKSYARDGIKGFWIGWGPNVVRNSLINAAEVATYDHAKQTLLYNFGFKD